MHLPCIFASLTHNLPPRSPLRSWLTVSERAGAHLRTSRLSLSDSARRTPCGPCRVPRQGSYVSSPLLRCRVLDETASIKRWGLRSHDRAGATNRSRPDPHTHSNTPQQETDSPSTRVGGRVREDCLVTRPRRGSCCTDRRDATRGPSDAPDASPLHLRVTHTQSPPTISPEIVADCF